MVPSDYVVDNQSTRDVGATGLSLLEADGEGGSGGGCVALAAYRFGEPSDALGVGGGRRDALMVSGTEVEGVGLGEGKEPFGVGEVMGECMPGSYFDVVGVTALAVAPLRTVSWAAVGALVGAAGVVGSRAQPPKVLPHGEMTRRANM